ncbi:unnamed protein product, partial [Rotaria magnacalcarata]
GTLLNFYLPGCQNDNDNFIEVSSYTSSREECRHFDDNNDCEVDEEEEDGNKNENDEEAIDILPYCSSGK